LDFLDLLELKKYFDFGRLEVEVEIYSSEIWLELLKSFGITRETNIHKCKTKIEKYELEEIRTSSFFQYLIY